MRVIASITSCKQCGRQLSRNDLNYLSTNSEHSTFHVYSPIKEATMRQDKTVQYRPICDTYSAISTHMRHAQCNTPTHMRPYSAISTHMRRVQCNINPYATRTVQYQPMCDTYSAISTHMRHVQCNTAPYAPRIYSALTPIHAICDT